MGTVLMPSVASRFVQKHHVCLRFAFTPTCGRLETMKPRLDVDWDLAMVLYTKGVQPSVIAQQLEINVHSLKKHAQRHEWTALKAKCNEYVSLNEPTNSAKKTVSFAERSKAVREGLALDLHGTVEMLPKLQRSTKAARLRERQAVVDQVATTSEKVFNWDRESDGEPIVNVLQLSNSVTSNRYTGPRDQMTTGPQDSVIDAQVLPESEQDWSI